jgi:DHA3 family macrolide efflux protein-like MFS transporter
VTVLYVAATIACFALPASPPLPAPPGLAGRAVQAAIAQLREGFAAVRDNRDVGRPLLHLAASASLVGVIGVLGPDLATLLGLPTERLVVIVLPLGLGVVAGVLGLRRFGRRMSRRRAAEVALGAFAILSAAIALAGPVADLFKLPPPIPVVAALAFCAGAAYAATAVSAQTALFEEMPPRVRGRIFGVLASIVSAASLVPVLVAGPLADEVTAPVVIVVVSAAVFATAVLSARLFGTRR